MRTFSWADRTDFSVGCNWNIFSKGIDFSKLGKTVSAFIDISMPSESYHKFIKFAKESDLIVECHHVTGGDSLIIKVLVDNISELELMIDEIKQFAKTNTSIILSSPIADKVIEFD